MSLQLLVAQDLWQEFDDAWTKLISSGGAVEEVVAALRIVQEKKRMARCMQMVRTHVEALELTGRHADAARLLGCVVSSGSGGGELAPMMFDHIQKAWGSNEWYPAYAQIAGIREGNSDARGVWIAFERLLSFVPGKLVHHPGGWGVGEVKNLHAEALEIDVQFGSGKKDRFPLSAAVDIFEPLSEEDLRAQNYRDADGLRKRMKDDPLSVLRAIVTRHGGRASNVGIKNAMLQVGIDGSAWSSWWKKARQAAEHSEWFRVTGTAAKGDIMLLRAATDPVADMRKTLEHLGSLQDLMARLKTLMASKPTADMHAMMLEVLEKKIAASTEKDSIKLPALMMLRDERGTTPQLLLERLQAAAAEPAPADPAATPVLWRLFNLLTQMRDQEHCVQLLQEAFPETWSDEGLKNLSFAPQHMVRPLVDALASSGKKAELGALYIELLSRPLRAPDVLVTLARLAESGKLKGNWPAPAARAQALLTLSVNLGVRITQAKANGQKKLEEVLERTAERLVELLTKGEDSLLRRLLENADASALRSVRSLARRGVDERIEVVVSDLTLKLATAEEKEAESWFWTDDRIWTTKAGLERRSAELKHLRDVKIPANQDAIGRAAAMGDLSENAEWEAAIEEQRNLTNRAQEIEAELRAAELIENAILPESLASPGTKVVYRDAAGTHEALILGPWDTEGDERVLSYRAPLAWGLLGHKAGDTVRIQLPSGVVELTLVSVSAVPLEA
jgi:transcription elongation GreA/GreB family factor